MIRLFVAVDLPDSTKDQLMSISQGISGARWLPRNEMHLTVRFIGEVEDATYRAIRTALGAVRAEPFTIALKGVGQFPPKGAPRVVWVGVDQPPGLLALYDTVESKLTGLGLPPEGRAFMPHITLARVKTPPLPEAIRQYMSKNAGFVTPPIPVNAFVLYSSFLRPDGPFYRHEGVYPLQTE